MLFIAGLTISVHIENNCGLEDEPWEVPVLVRMLLDMLSLTIVLGTKCSGNLPCIVRLHCYIISPLIYI